MIRALLLLLALGAVARGEDEITTQDARLFCEVYDETYVKKYITGQQGQHATFCIDLETGTVGGFVQKRNGTPVCTIEGINDYSRGCSVLNICDRLIDTCSP